MDRSETSVSAGMRHGRVAKPAATEPAAMTTTAGPAAVTAAARERRARRRSDGHDRRRSQYEDHLMHHGAPPSAAICIAAEPNVAHPRCIEDRSLRRLRAMRTRPFRPALEHARIAIRVGAEILKLLMRQFVTN
jgi:hypothetical protein